VSFTFKDQDLRRMAAVLPDHGSSDEASLFRALRRKQPHFFQMIGEVGMDPRCAEAHSFCTIFCALAMDHAERCARCRLPKYPAIAIREIARSVAQHQVGVIGRRACQYRSRVRRHVLGGRSFDESDTGWLCTTISAFLLAIERSQSQ
jgi:hypothetical protein